MLCSCQHHNKDVRYIIYTSKKQICFLILHVLQYLEADPWSSRSPSKYRVKFMSLHYLSFEKPQLLCSCRPSQAKPAAVWVGMAPCLLVFLAEGFPNRVADLIHRNTTSRRSDVSQGSTYKLKSLNMKIRTNSDKNTRYQQQNKNLLILIEPLHLLVEVLFYYDDFHFSLHQMIKPFPHFLESHLCNYSYTDSGKFPLFDGYMICMSTAPDLLSSFKRGTIYWYIHFCLPEVFAANIIQKKR